MKCNENTNNDRSIDNDSSSESSGSSGSSIDSKKMLFGIMNLDSDDDSTNSSLLSKKVQTPTSDEPKMNVDEKNQTTRTDVQEKKKSISSEEILETPMMDDEPKRKKPKSSSSSVINFDMDDSSSSDSSINPSDMLLGMSTNTNNSTLNAVNEVTNEAKSASKQTTTSNNHETENDDNMFDERNSIKIGIGSSVFSWKRKRQNSSKNHISPISTIALDTNDRNIISQSSLLRVKKNTSNNGKDHDWKAKLIPSKNTLFPVDREKYIDDDSHDGNVIFPSTNDEVINCVAIYDEAQKKYILEIVDMTITNLS